MIRHGLGNTRARNCSRGKRRRPTVAAFELDVEHHLLRLAAELRSGLYRPGPYRLKLVHRPKIRLIAAAPVRDRVVHHALHRELAPWLDRSFIDDSFACREGRGSQRAVLRLLERMRRHRHVMCLDVRRYFLSIRHEVLLDLLSRQVRDPRVIELLHRIVQSAAGLYTRPEVVQALGLQDDPVPPGTGLPLGNLTSQWWGNLYLDGLDHFVKRRLKVGAYQRYLDDLTLFSDDPAELRGWREEIAGWLQEQRGLRLKPGCGQVRRTSSPLVYLGCRISRAGIDPAPKLRRRVRFRLERLACSGDLERLRRSLSSWRGLWLFPAGGTPRICR